MCGLNGIFAYKLAAPLPDQAELLATRDAMRARGPDGAGAWRSANGRCALANRRLAILDLGDEAAMPMANADGTAVVTYNGEIYNYKELRRDLESKGVQFRTNGDTEVLLHLYEQYGVAMVRRLRGMFAFAIWDERKNELFLARDGYGIKPLYTANDGWTFRFASQVKALLAGGRIARDVEPAGLVGFRLFGHVPEPFTLYSEIRALPAGHMQIVDSVGPCEPVPFFNIASILATGASNPAPVTDFPAGLRAALAESVRSHLLADVEVGVFLSAGVDSGTLLGLLRDAGHGGIRAITLAYDEFEGGADDEAPLAREIASLYGAKHSVRRVTEAEFHDDLPAILDAMDQPTIDGINTWFVAKAARESGLKVALSGLGGDELLAGYPSFVDVPRWRHYFGPLAAVPGLGRLIRSTVLATVPEVVQQRPKALGLLRYSNGWPGAYLLRRALFLPDDLASLMDPELAREGLRRLMPLRRLGNSLKPDPNSDIGRICALESTHYLRDQLLRDADWAGMAHSVEIRTPYVDTRLLEAVAPFLPTLKAGGVKSVLAKAHAIALPQNMVSRPKSGFNVPMATWSRGVRSPARARAKEGSGDRGLVSRRWSNTVIESYA